MKSLLFSLLLFSLSPFLIGQNLEIGSVNEYYYYDLYPITTLAQDGESFTFLAKTFQEKISGFPPEYNFDLSLLELDEEGQIQLVTKLDGLPKIGLGGGIFPLRGEQGFCIPFASTEPETKDKALVLYHYEDDGDFIEKESIVFEGWGSYFATKKILSNYSAVWTKTGVNQDSTIIGFFGEASEQKYNEPLKVAFAGYDYTKKESWFCSLKIPRPAGSSNILNFYLDPDGNANIIVNVRKKSATVELLAMKIDRKGVLTQENIPIPTRANKWRYDYQEGQNGDIYTLIFQEAPKKDGWRNLTLNIINLDANIGLRTFPIALEDSDFTNIPFGKKTPKSKDLGVINPSSVLQGIHEHPSGEFSIIFQRRYPNSNGSDVYGADIIRLDASGKKKWTLHIPYILREKGGYRSFTFVKKIYNTVQGEGLVLLHNMPKDNINNTYREMPARSEGISNTSDLLLAVTLVDSEGNWKREIAYSDPAENTDIFRTLQLSERSFLVSSYFALLPEFRTPLYLHKVRIP